MQKILKIILFSLFSYSLVFAVGIKSSLDIGGNAYIHGDLYLKSDKTTPETAAIQITKGSNKPAIRWTSQGWQYTNNGTTWNNFGSGGSGGGDMLKSVYDTNNNGIVDNSENVIDNSISNAKIQDNAISTNKIQDGAITTLKIQDNAITTTKLNDYSVNETKLANNSVSTIKIQSGAITTDKLADDSVNSAKIVNGTITNADISSTAGIALSKLSSYPFGTSDIQDSAITETKIQNNAISTVKIQDNAITGTKIQNGVITENHLSPVAKILKTNEVLTLPSISGNSGKFLKTDGTGLSWDSPSGGGDMYKSVYDVNNNGVVDNSEKITGLSFPSVSGNSGKFLKTDGTGLLWDTPSAGSGSPGGNNKTIQYNNNGSFAGNDNLTWDSGLQQLSVLGKVGIGTTTPEFKLSLDNDGGIIAKGTYGSGNTLTTSGAGTRLIWYPRKAAFRVGGVDGSQWDDTNIANYSTAMGFNTIASASYSTAMGYNTTASASFSTAMGGSTTASGSYSTAMGFNTTASGSYSTVMGYYASANSFCSVAIGKWNVGGGSASSWVSTDPLFEIGIGTDGSHKANALTVLKNGNVGIGTTTPQAKLDISGNIKIADGTQGAGKVLTSDANGVASWQTPTGGGVSGSGTINTYPKWTGSTTLGDGAISETTPSGHSTGIRISQDTYFDSGVLIKVMSSKPQNPPPGYIVMYYVNGKFYYKDSAGTETELCQTVVSGGSSGDTRWETDIVFNFNGSDGQTYTSSNPNYGRVLNAEQTGFGGGSGAILSTSVKKYGTASLSLDGMGKGMAVENPKGFQLRTDNWCWEGWVYFGESLMNPQPFIECTANWGTNGRWYYTIYYDPMFQYLYFEAVINGTVVAYYYAPWSASSSTWYHWAVERDGNNCRMFIDGTELTVTTSTAFGTSIEGIPGALYIGCDGGGGMSLNGYLDDIRFRRSAPYTGNFTPPNEW